jgi:hypothetical protein
VSHFNGMHKAAMSAMLPDMGESITYTPSGGQATTIKAVVNRGYIVDVGDPSVLDYEISISVSRDDIAAVVVGADTVAIKRDLDDSSATTMTVRKILDQSGGAWLLAVS